ncbi:hypothetical protein DKX38_023688 [Salix brachista]|uniref:Uncharacterized protein n=1 Tax=Salix brachista TaxID=2182728 RepID=A0A5N5JJG0_9ROSI|nr:hypothetical protein DKX38_023688 [Salix brachista]
MLQQGRPMKLSDELEITIYRGYGCIDGVYSSSTTGAATITAAANGSSLRTGHDHVPSCFAGLKSNITNAQRLHSQCNLIAEGILDTSCFSFIFNFPAPFLNICATRIHVILANLAYLCTISSFSLRRLLVQ